MRDAFGVTVTEANVGNNLKTRRRRWVAIKKLKEMSNIGWENYLKYRDYVKGFVILHIYLYLQFI